jgi:hypothetical protein
MSLVKPLTCAFLSLWLLAAAWPTAYYVSSAGDDSATGLSPLHPWKTIAKVNSHSYHQGDQVLFQGGGNFSGQLYITTNAAGTAANPVHFSTYGAGKAIISAGNGVGILVYNVGGVAIENLSVRGNWNATGQFGNNGTGIYLYTDLDGAVKLPAVSIKQCSVQGFKNGGVVVASSPSDNSQSGFDHASIYQCQIFNNGDCGISSYGPYPSAPTPEYAHTNLYVGWDTVYGNQGIRNLQRNTGNGIVLGDAQNAVIEHCVAHDNGSDSTYTGGGPAGIWTWDSNDVVIQFCEAYKNRTGTGTPDGDGFDLDGGATNCIVQYNYSHENEGAGFLVYEFGDTRGYNANNVIRFNVSQNDDQNNSGYAGLYLASYCSNDLIYNNTFYNATHPPIFINGGTNIWVFNNIFFANGNGNISAQIGTQSCWFLNNDYWTGHYAQQIRYLGTTYNSLAAFQTAGQETWNGTPYGFALDPLLANPGVGGTAAPGYPFTMTAYKLTALSPLLGAGLNLNAWGIEMGPQDFYNQLLPPVNVGAY